MIRINVSFTIFITLFLLMFGCKKETPTNSNNEACSPNWSSVSDSGCLEISNDFFIYNYYNGELDTNMRFSGTNTNKYEGRKLVAYHPQNGPKYIPVTYYEYNECNQLTRTSSTNLRSDIIYYYSDYKYYNDGKIDRINYLEYSKFDKQTITTGHTQYLYYPNLLVVHTFDGGNNKTKSDSTIYNNLRNVVEVWNTKYSNNNISLVKNSYKVSKYGTYNAGDEISTLDLSNNQVNVSKIDSVFYNEFGLDTLYYNSFYQNNILKQIRVIKRKYFGCN